MTDITLDQFARVGVVAVHRDGSAASVQDAAWTSSDETVVRILTAAFDPFTGRYSAVVDTVAVGSARVVFNGDADLGDGVKPVSVAYDFAVTPGSAVFLNAEAVVLEDKAAPAPSSAPAADGGSAPAGVQA